MSMFVDVTTIRIKSGNGGDGAVSFHREKYVQRGGPDGGDGGHGGSIVFLADEGMRTLLDFRYERKFFAQPGENGSGSNRTGKNGEDLVIKVPPGTRVTLKDTGELVADLLHPGERRVVLKGGRGGRGNARFATPTRQTPSFAQPGQRTQEYEVQLELKSIADVGLVGFPNVGKSTLLSVVSSARPKIADYHFTTLTPNLGVVRQDGYSFVMADIPGIIENAHEGVGLGIAFLRHIERTRLLIHVVDAAGIEGRDPVEDYELIRHELVSYQPRLAALPQVVAANKTDIPGAQENVDRLRAHLGDGVEVFPISAATRQGIEPLMHRVAAMLRELPEPEETEAEEVTLEHRLEQTYEVSKAGDIYLVEGPLADRILSSMNADNRHSVSYFQTALQKSGIIDALRAAGARDGDTVCMGDMEFDFVE